MTKINVGDKVTLKSHILRRTSDGPILAVAHKGDSGVVTDVFLGPNTKKEIWYAMIDLGGRELKLRCRSLHKGTEDTKGEPLYSDAILQLADEIWKRPALACKAMVVGSCARRGKHKPFDLDVYWSFGNDAMSQEFRDSMREVLQLTGFGTHLYAWFDPFVLCRGKLFSRTDDGKHLELAHKQKMKFPVKIPFAEWYKNLTRNRPQTEESPQGN